LKGEFALCCDGIIVVLVLFAYFSSTFFHANASDCCVLQFDFYFILERMIVRSIKVLYGIGNSLSTKRHGESPLGILLAYNFCALGIFLILIPNPERVERKLYPLLQLLMLRRA
jgi:hypothetical protein